MEHALNLLFRIDQVCEFGKTIYVDISDDTIVEPRDVFFLSIESAEGPDGAAYVYNEVTLAVIRPEVHRNGMERIDGPILELNVEIADLAAGGDDVLFGEAVVFDALTVNTFSTGDTIIFKDAPDAAIAAIDFETSTLSIDVDHDDISDIAIFLTDLPDIGREFAADDFVIKTNGIAAALTIDPAPFVDLSTPEDASAAEDILQQITMQTAMARTTLASALETAFAGGDGTVEGEDPIADTAPDPDGYQTT